MRFLLDENIGKSVALLLTQLGHTTFRVKEIHPGLKDFKVLELATEKDAILITLDKDFGELVFRKGKLHKGVIFMRMEDQTSDNIKRVLSWFLTTYSHDQIENKFVVVTEKSGKFTAKINPLRKNLKISS